MAEENNDASSSGENGLAGIVEVDTLTISNHQGQNVDVRAIFTEIETTTSIFQPGLSGSVLLYDAQGLINRLPIVGEETITISFKTPGNDPKTGTFLIWKVTDESADNKGLSSAYRLHFCGPEMFENAKTVVAKSYDNTDDVSAIVSDIMNQYLKSQKQVEARGVIRDPAKKLVIPMYRPLEAIDMLLRRAYSGDKSKSDWFLFFERWDKWALRMYDSLVEQPINRRLTIRDGTPAEQFQGATKDKIETWYVYQSDKYLSDSIRGRDIRRVVSMVIESRFDSLAKIREGAYENEVVQYSIKDKAITSQVFKYQRDAKNMPILGGGDDAFDSGVPQDKKLKANTNTDAFMARYNTAESGFAGSQASKVFFRLKDPEEKDGVVKKAGWLYRSARVLADQIRITITVPGDSMVDAGDIIHFAIPRFDSIEDEAQPDKFIYGKYIVGAIRDSILAPDKHAMTLDLYRDGNLSEITASELHEDI